MMAFGSRHTVRCRGVVSCDANACLGDDGGTHYRRTKQPTATTSTSHSLPQASESFRVVTRNHS
jgi:hypothetical protein